MDTFTLLLFAHLAADFPLQTRAIVRAKKRPRVFALHVGIVALTAWAALASIDERALAAVAAIAASHAAIDWIKTRHRLGRRAWAFALDQALHLGVIGALAWWSPDLATSGLWGLFAPDDFVRAMAFATLAAGTIVTVWVGQVVLGFATRRLAAQVADEPRGLAQGGRIIGQLERGLILLLVLIDQPEGVGLLLAAKSILRFGENERKRTEYVIIGTLMSFGWALAAAQLTKDARDWWRPPAPLPCASCVPAPT